MRRSTTSVAARSRRVQFRKNARELSTAEQSQASLRRGQRARRTAFAPAERSQGGRGCQETLMSSAVSGSAALFTPVWVFISGMSAQFGPANGAKIMSLGTILVIILIIFLLGGFSGRFGGYGYGFGHGGIGILGAILIVIVILMLLGRI